MNHYKEYVSVYEKVLFIHTRRFFVSKRNRLEARIRNTH